MSWCRDCSCWQLLAGLWAISILTGQLFPWSLPCITSACSQTLSLQSSGPDCHAVGHCTASVSPDGGPVSQLEELFGGIGSSLFVGPVCSFFFPVVCCVWRIETAFSPCPSTCPISWFITGDSSAGPESSEVKRCGVCLCGRSTCSVFKLASCWGRGLTELGADLLWAGDHAWAHHLQQWKGVPCLWLWARLYSPGHNSVVYIMSTYIIYFIVLSWGLNKTMHMKAISHKSAAVNLNVALLLLLTSHRPWVWYVISLNLSLRCKLGTIILSLQIVGGLMGHK